MIQPYLKIASAVIFISSLLCITACEDGTDTLFRRVPAADTGISFNNTILENDTANILTEEYIFNGGGIAVGDFNNDGKPDLYFTGNQVDNALYLNQGDFKFRDISKTSGITASGRWSTGVTSVDINADGLLDVYVCAAREGGELRRNMLFVNQGMDNEGIPVFREMAADYGIDDPGNSMGAAFFDYDKDGYLDLYVVNNEQLHILPTNYRKKVTDGSAASNDRLYHNNGDGTFTDVTMEAGITIEGFGLGIAISDVNYDGWPDVYVTNDYLTNDLLYINQGDGTFLNEIQHYIKHQSKFSMGTDISDFNNDGYLDIITLDMLGETNYRMKTTIGNNPYISYVLNDRWGYEYQYSRNTLQVGNGLAPFSEVGLLAGVAKTDWSWSPLFMDADNDGFRDLLITNGFPRDITDKDFGDFRVGISPFVSPHKILDSIPVVKIPNYAYRNTGNLQFVDSGAEWGLNIPSFSNGAAFSDLDGDGDLDYIVNNINEEAFVFQNMLEDNKENNYLKINLEGPENNPLGIGAKITVRQAGGRFQYHEHHLSRGYMSSVDPLIHFGLGTEVQLAAVEVLWPDGRLQRVEAPAVNQTISLEYQKASRQGPQIAEFPLEPKNIQPLLNSVNIPTLSGVIHKEQDVIDYNRQRILPHKLSQNGPVLQSGDLNGDGHIDFIMGSSSGYSPLLYIQQSDGSFLQKELFIDAEAKKTEQEDISFFDLDNDGNLDLYLANGGNEYQAGSPYYQDQILMNNGQGHFTLLARAPALLTNTSTVSAADFNGDGWTDLFVGGRNIPGQFPLAEKSYLLKNENGKLVPIELLPLDGQLGMVTDAIWADIDQDTKPDLVVVGEMMPIRIFMNKQGKFQEMENSGLENYIGWWETILAHDFDKDGDLDLVAGNMGSNNWFQPSQDKPVKLIAKDFDQNGSIDPILFAHFKDRDGNFNSFPVPFWGDLFGQSPLFRSKFNFYKDYATATEESLLTAGERKGALELIANYDQSSYIENLGNGKFDVRPLPVQAQYAPVNSLLASDLDMDGITDLILVGNNYGNETFIGRYDALNGLVLLGGGDGTFHSLPTEKSGFVVPGDAKSLLSVKKANGEEIYIATQNRGPLLIFERAFTGNDKPTP